MGRHVLIATLMGGLLLLPNAALADNDGDHGDRHERDSYRYGYDDGCGYYGCGGYYSEPSGSSTFIARMTGDQEVPKKGPAGAKGRAQLDVDPYEHRLCYMLDYTGIRPTGGHVHRGRRGEAGPVAVDLRVAQNGDRGCVPISYGLGREMQTTPQDFYVNLHTAEYPDGAIRGQVDYPYG